MPRPATKQDLIQAANENFEKIWKLIDSMPIEVQNAEFNFSNIKKAEAHWQRDKNLRDVLVHLYEWHQLSLRWVAANQEGEERSFLPEPYTWKTYGQMNVMFWEKHQKTSYDEAKKMLLASHQQVLSLAETFTNDELFAKKVFKWTGSSSLGSYLVSNTSSHYDWALKKIKMHVKTYME